MCRLLIIILFLSLNTALFAQDNGHLKETAPRPLNLATVARMIQYPDSARVNGIEGRVVVKVLVDAYGDVERVSDEIEGLEVFHKEITRISWKLKFSPALIDDVPVKCWVSVPFRFQLSYPPEDDE